MTSKADKKAKKQLDLQVLSILVEAGILNHLHGKMLSNVAQLVHDIDCKPMKPYKTVRHAQNDNVAAEFVIEYLKRHQMWDTIRCIEAETDGELSQASVKKPTGVIEREFKITQKEGLLEAFAQQWMDLLQENIIEDNAAALKEGIAARIEAAQSQRRSHRTGDAKKQTEKSATTRQLPPQPPKKSSPAKAETTTVVPANDDDFEDLDSEDEPVDTKAKTQAARTSAKEAPGKPAPKTSPLPSKNDSSGLNGSSFQDVDDEPETLVDKRAVQPIPKAAAQTIQPRRNDQSESSDLQDIDDMLDDMNATEPAKKPQPKSTNYKDPGSARRGRPSDLDDEDLNFSDDEPSPVKKQNAGRLNQRVRVGLASDDDDISLGLSSDSPPKRPSARPPVKTAPIRASNATETDSDIPFDVDNW